MYPIFKEKSNYPDFLHIRMARRPNYSGLVELYCTFFALSTYVFRQIVGQKTNQNHIRIAIIHRELKMKGNGLEIMHRS